MKPRAWFFALALVVGAVELVSACSESVPLARVGGKCEYDEQCSTGLVCKCVKKRNPDDEGPDEILVPGTCQDQSFSCKADAGVTDTGKAVDSSPVDTGSTDSADAGSADAPGDVAADADDAG